MKLRSICAGLALLFTLPISSVASAAPACFFAKSGNAITGTTYEASLLIDVASSSSVLSGVRAKLEASGQKTLSFDPVQGTLKAEQPSSNPSRSLPIAASVRQNGNQLEAKVSISLRPLQTTRDDAVNAELCSYLQGPYPSDQTSPASVNSKTAQSASIPDSEFSKGGMPCLSGICIGDDITKVTSVQWNAVDPGTNQKPVPATDGQVQLLQKTLIAPDATLRKVASSIQAFHFNSAAISSLRDVRAACGSLQVVTSFMSQSGHLTRVFAQPTAVGSSETPTFLVTHVMRVFKDAVTSAQKQDITASLLKAYAPIIHLRETSYSKQGELPNVLITSDAYLNLQLELLEPAATALARVDRLRSNALCGGAKTIKID